MTSKAFKKGFVDGFSAPFSFFNATPVRSEKYQASVETAWKDVGDAFRDVMAKQGDIIGKERHEKKRQSGKRAA
ncbi:hypothetical protein ACCS96_26025 [Rhizobium ruizarguesonis]